MPGGIYSSGKQKGRNVLEDTKLVAPDLQVAARPTDPYVQTFKDNDTNNIFGQLQGLVKASAPIAMQGAQEAQDQGRRAWNPGGPDIEGPNGELIPAPISTREPSGILARVFKPAYQSGYDKIDGEHKASLYYNEAYQFAQDNKNKPKGELEAGLAELRQKYMGSMVSDVQLDAWLPRAAAVEEKLIQDHVVDGIKMQHNEARGMAKANYRTRTLSDIMPLLNAIGISSLEELATVEGQEVFRKNSREVAPLIRKVMRRNLSAFQQENGAVFSKAEISADYAEVAVGLADLAVTPEFLDFGKEPESEASAATLRDRNDPQGNSIGAYLDGKDRSIDSRRVTLANMDREEKLRLQKERNDAASVDFAAEGSQLYLSKDYPAAVLAYEEKLRSYTDKNSPNYLKGLTFEHYSAMATFLDNKKKRDRHPAQSLKETKDAFWKLYQHGSATPEWVAARQSELNEVDYDNFSNWSSHSRKAANDQRNEGNRAWATNTEYNSKAYSQLPKQIDPYDPSGSGKADPEGGAKAAAAQQMLMDDLNAYAMSHRDSKGIPQAAPAEEVQKILLKIYAKYPPFQEPTSEDWSATVKKLKEEQKMPASLADFQKPSVYYSFSPKERWIIGAIFRNEKPPKPIPKGRHDR